MSRFDFRNRSGQTLAGRLELPNDPPKAMAVFAHCFTCSKNAKAATRISKRLAASGIGVLRFDFTGLGNSEGDFANSNFSSNVSDLIDASDEIGQRFEPPTILIGHSLGGAAALMAAAELSDVQAVATVGTPSEPAHLQQLLGNAVEDAKLHGTAQFELGGRVLTLKRQFVDDLVGNRISSILPGLRKTLMIFHSPLDGIVDVNQARLLFETAKHPKSFISLDGADHMLIAKEDAEYVADMIAAWLNRYLQKRGNAVVVK